MFRRSDSINGGPPVGTVDATIPIVRIIWLTGIAAMSAADRHPQSFDLFLDGQLRAC